MDELNINKALARAAFRNREEMKYHLPYEREMEFYQSVKMGNAEEVNRLFKPFNSEGLGKLSDDPVRNLKYHLIITIAFITRYCIEGGMEPETAYNLSDVYIQRIDKYNTEDEINRIHRELVDDYVHRMKVIHKNGLYTKPILVCLDYIYDNLHNKITLDELAEKAGLSPTYLSAQFHSEVGVTIKQYIIGQRIEAAENLLKYSDYTCLEISNYLCFCSESHFIHVFKKYTKITPKEYREKFFRTRWGNKAMS
jgi:AraC-like DNA-binding protein